MGHIKAIKQTQQSSLYMIVHYLIICFMLYNPYMSRVSNLSKLH
jgi:hypothetical protein